MTETAIWGASPSDWAQVVALGLQRDLLPTVCNPQVELSENSKLGSIYKAPGLKNKGGKAVGFPAWTKHESSDRDIGRWSQDEDLGLCIQTRRARALDIDVPNEARAREVEEWVCDFLMMRLPVRWRENSGKRLLLLSAEGHMTKRIGRMADGSGVVELLANGQQFVAVGTHRTGVRYVWGPGAEHAPDELPEVPMALLEELWAGLVNDFCDGKDSRVGQGNAALSERRRADMDDPVADWLMDQGWLRADGQGIRDDGVMEIQCPWVEEHESGPGSPSSTVYFPAGVGGQARGQFKCLHATCEEAGRSLEEFWEKVGWEEPVADDFEIVGEEVFRNPASVLSEQWLANNLVRKHGSGMRHTDGLGWMLWDGGVWRPDVGEDIVGRWATDVCMEASVVAVARLYDKPARGLAERRRLESAGMPSRVLQAARTRERVKTDQSMWDSHPMLLNTPAGVVDLRRGLVKEGDGKDLLLTQCSGLGPGGDAPRWARFIDDVTGGDAEFAGFLQRLCGYFLTGDVREQKLFFFWGPGGNGKSVFMNVLLAALGDYAHTMDSRVLTTKGEDDRFSLIHLRGKRLALSSELSPGARWSTHRIKSLTGGDEMTAEGKGTPFVSWKPTHKLVIVGNDKPDFRGDDVAMADRMVLIPFTQRFRGTGSEDKDLERKLERELPGVMEWMVQGAAAWAREGLALPAAVKIASEDYRSEQDTLALWLEECCELVPDAVCAVSDLYSSYGAWAEGQGLRGRSKRELGEWLSGQGFERVRGASNVPVGGRPENGLHLGRPRCFRGVRLACDGGDF